MLVWLSLFLCQAQFLKLPLVLLVDNLFDVQVEPFQRGTSTNSTWNIPRTKKSSLQAEPIKGGVTPTKNSTWNIPSYNK